MAKIRKYFRNVLITLATMILASFAVTNHTSKDSDFTDDSDDFHMFI
jgi:hypothetical protein